MNTPDDASDTQINSLFELADAMTKRHARDLLADPALGERLDRASGLNPETLLGNQPIPDQSLDQVGMESYTDCNGKRCYRPMGEGETQRRLNRIRDNFEYRAHVEAVYREVTMRRLDQIDPDWRDHCKTFEAAELRYRLELQKIGDDSEVNFDADLTDDDAR